MYHIEFSKLLKRKLISKYNASLLVVWNMLLLLFFHSSSSVLESRVAI